MKVLGKRNNVVNAVEIREVTEKRAKVTLSRKRRGAGLLGLALAGLIAFTPAATMADQFLNDGGASPIRGTAQVVAQTVVDLGDGEVAWRITDGEIDADGLTFAAPSDGFLVGDEGVMLLTDETGGMVQRVAAGEAVALRDGAEYDQLALGEDEAVFFWIGLGEDGPDRIFAGESFDELGGLRDVDLLRDSLKAKGKAKLPAGDGPTLILATGGEIEVRAGEGEAVTLRAGDAAEFEGAVEIVAGEDGRATYVAGIIGERLDAGAEVVESGTPISGGTGGSSSGGGSGNGSGGDSGSGGGQVPQPAVDTDGDGINDALEAQIGTDPTNPDTDYDGLLDGDEYYTYGSDPLSIDSDGDGLPDYNEVMQHGTDPADADSDNDGINDHDELNLGTMPLNPDTDGDGLSDGYEVDHGSNFFEQDTDMDGLLDGDEVHLYGSSPTSMDTDGDGLPDYNEVMQHGTSPALYDTDGDNINDHDELGYGTDLLDPDSDDDGALDGDEILSGHNPLDPNSKP